MTQTNEAEARIVEAILTTGGDYMTGARKQVTEAFALFKERSEMRTGELEAKLELAKVRDEQRKEALAEANAQIAMLEQRERELEARVERAEAREDEEPVRRVDATVYSDADTLMADDTLLPIMAEADKITQPDTGLPYAVAFLLACVRCGIPADVVRERMSRA